MERHVITDFNGSIIEGRTPEHGDIVRETHGANVVEYIYTPQAPAEPQEEVRRVIKADFLRLFTASERVAFNLQRKLVEALQPADYTDPAKAALVGLEVFLLTYDAIDVIELTHPETIEGMGVLVALGVVTQARAEAVLAGTPPT
jgi:hypothetical protein